MSDVKRYPFARSWLILHEDDMRARVVEIAGDCRRRSGSYVTLEQP